MGSTITYAVLLRSQVGPLLAEAADAGETIELTVAPAPAPAAARLVPGCKHGSDGRGAERVWRQVLRVGSAQYASLSLKPQPWSGRGLLGCHIVPR